MKPSTAILVVGLVVFAVAAAPLVEFTYSAMEGRGVLVRVAAANATQGAACGSGYYEVVFSYEVPVPLTEARAWATFTTPSGNFTYANASSVVAQGANLTLCVPQGVAEEARGIDVGLSGSIAGLYPYQVEERVSVGGQT